MLITIGGAGGAGATTLDGLTDASIVTASTGQQFRFSNAAWRNATPQRFNLWDYVLDQLAGAAYSTSHRLFGCSITSGSTNCLIQGTASSDNGTPPPLVVGTRPVSTEVELLGVAGYDRSYRARAGHAVVAGDFGTFSSTWGSSGAPSIAVATGGNVYRGNATITAGGATGIGANPTVVFTFPKAFTAAPVVLVGRSGTGAGGTSNFTVENISTTSCRIIYGGTPTATATYSFSWIIQE